MAIHAVSPPNLTPTMSLTSLPPDVLHTIVSSLPHRDLLSVTTVCGHLRKVGIECLLARPITINSEPQLASFCRFMLSEKCAERVLLLRQLRLIRLVSPEAVLDGLDHAITDSILDTGERQAHPWRHDFDNVMDREYSHQRCGTSMLVDVLQRATELQDLDMDELEILLSVAKPALTQAISSLPKLCRLTITGYGRWTRQLCRSLVSPHLRAIDVDFWHESAEPADDGTISYRALMALLSRYPEIEEVTAKNVTFAAPHKNLEPSVAASRAVHTLVLQGISGALSLHQLVEAFPNVRKLKLSGLSTTLPDTAYYSSQALRALNGGVARWQTLDELSGDLVSLYALNLQGCRVGRLVVNGPFALGDPQNLDRAFLAHQYATVIADAWPTSLRLTWTHHRRVVFGDPWLFFKDVCRASVAFPKLAHFGHGVRHLALDLCFSMSWESIDIPSVEGFPCLQTLVLRVRTAVGIPAVAQYSSGVGDVLVLKNLNTKDTRTGYVVQRVLRSHPTLQHVALALPYNGCMRHWWKSMTPEGSVVEVTEDVGRQLLAEAALDDLYAFA
ncbi:uncharacterized protein BXZ73DRAFT_105992 [Epithele typhae]|uniref:uncharacterized protein n=1 Tax=Epithele typhae TaxID=378194 RepID=UPI002008E5FD|nr:uncharacterized protein BXZ73DRAFT_105992 [Epithele typhae]KAH9915926.1 hypothetical protein BXZ73DRAFT_105992 [Epithele typhae]